LKQEDTCSRKCGCLFWLSGYFSASKLWSISILWDIYL